MTALADLMTTSIGAGASSFFSSSSPSSSSSFGGARGAAPSPAGPPSHHAPGGGFRNPPEWRSCREATFSHFFWDALPDWDYSTAFPPLAVAPVPFDVLRAPRAPLQALFVGHATFFVQARGVGVLTDPFFSERPSPVSFIGPQRYSPPACAVEELPPVDVVLISHSHYDHLDAASVAALQRKARADAARDEGYGGITWCVPLGLATLLEDMGVPRSDIRELDWWRDATVRVRGGAASLRVTAVPAQHNSARTPWDRNTTLWCGFACSAAGADPAAPPSAFYFSGDTGYRAVERGAPPFSHGESSAPRCPAFKEIGARCGPFDLALLPIGAYSPRGFMSSFHASPSDAVEMLADVNARAAVGMHWGALPLTDEPPLQPVEWLKEALRRKGASVPFSALRPGSVWPFAEPL
jgi:N-acyl-phosphatidylethanolamine-hydrolysing phospholipase D